jgi:hypothetical protein
MTRKVPTLTDAATINSTGRERSIANLRKGGGRPKGKPNKVNNDLREMILGALDEAGGQSYLARQADDNPASFLALIGKVLPKEVRAEVSGAIELVLAEKLKQARERIG